MTTSSATVSPSDDALRCALPSPICLLGAPGRDLSPVHSAWNRGEEPMSRHLTSTSLTISDRDWAQGAPRSCINTTPPARAG